MPNRPDVAVHLYEPSDAGLDRVAILLANGFRARGLAAELWLNRLEGANARLIHPDLPIRQLPAPFARRGAALAAQLPAMRLLVQAVQPRILLSAGNQANLVVALAALGTRTAAFGKITNPIDRPDRPPNPFRRARFDRTARLSALTLALSAADAATYAATFPRARFAFVHNPYVTPQMLALGVARVPSKQPCILTVGRLHEQKDQATLLAALALLQERPWRLTLAGDGPLHPALQEQAARLGLAARIEFAGFGDPLPHFAAADLFVLSSRWEGMPAVALEALACGLPLATTDCASGLSALVRTLDLPAPTAVGDAPALARAIADLLDRPRDPAPFVAAAAPWGVDAAIDDHLRLLAPFL